jgi:hypothetical protein
MDLTSLVGGLGIGSMVTLFLKEYFDKRRIVAQREFEEKKGAYVNYLDIVARSQAMPAQEGFWARTSATERIKLCGSRDVLRLLKIAHNAPPDSKNEVDALFEAMRNDLFPNLK